MIRRKPRECPLNQRNRMKTNSVRFPARTLLYDPQSTFVGTPYRCPREPRKSAGTREEKGFSENDRVCSTWRCHGSRRTAAVVFRENSTASKTEKNQFRFYSAFTPPPSPSTYCPEMFLSLFAIRGYRGHVVGNGRAE